VAIAGVGRNVAQVTARFRCSGPKPDLFRAIMARKLDTFVADANAPVYAKLVPAWYPELVGARSFVMLPLIHEGTLLGLIYGDYAEPRASTPPDLATGSMREWREQLLQALLSGTSKPV
jgi:hypothetical protein